MKRLPCLALAIAALPYLLHADSSLIEFVRRGDTAGLKSSLAARADPNTKDDTGATALMYAAAFGSDADVRLLLDAGAGLNAANAYGSTALMWAASDPAKVRQLLDRGAAPNARAIDRTTALLVAARLGNAESMRLLLERGANPKATAGDAAALLRIAYGAETPDLRELLARYGVDLQDARELGATVITQNLFDLPTLQRVLDAGGDPRQEVSVVTLNLPALGFAASSGQVEAVRLLLTRGAEAGRGGSRGWTPLMMAAAAAHPNPAVVDLLIAKGADPQARDGDGRTALDWALLQGDTPVAAQLRKAGARAMARPPPAPAAVATPRPALVALERAVARLQPASPGFTKGTKCVSCHNQSLPAMAMKLAGERGVPVDRALAAHPNEVTLASLAASREALLLGNAPAGGFVAGTPYSLTALAEQGIAPNAATDVAALALARVQRRDGGWELPVGHAGGGLRPPLGSIGGLALTALSIRGLSVYSPPGRQQETKARLARALEFLRQATPLDTQDESFKLMGLAWSKAPAPEIEAQARRLLSLQRTDGGWAQLPAMTPDAYATGQALYALRTGGISPAAETYRNGAAYLLRSQLEDGTWLVRSRGFGFQPYFETGFPHGRDQFLSTAATAWAAMALAFTL